MIVLDEQWLGRGLETATARWYPGRVCFITDLRPGSIIKDEAIPTLLPAEREPTFVTINERDEQTFKKARFERGIYTDPRRGAD